jgi:hypothetical protein
MLLARKQSNRRILPLFHTQRQWMARHGHYPSPLGMLSQMHVQQSQFSDMSTLFLVCSYRVIVVRLGHLGYCHHIQKAHHHPRLSTLTQSNTTHKLFLGEYGLVLWSDGAQVGSRYTVHITFYMVQFKASKHAANLTFHCTSLLLAVALKLP